MHPAYSVIFFTTASGAGYGLLFWLGLAHLADALPTEGALPLVALGLALLAITAGLLASTAHLGHPERAIGAFSQWRSSWLSREGVAAVVTYVPALLLGLMWLRDTAGTAADWFAASSAIGAVVTVWCTGMIYASLKTIRQWYMSLVPLIYLALAAATGALLLAGLFAVAGYPAGWSAWLAIGSLVVAAALKVLYWGRIDTDKGQYTAEMATGLGRFGTVRPLEPPHSRPNFVMREMGYRVARRHAERLRMLAGVALFAVPAVFVAIALATGVWAFFCVLAAAAAAVGVVMERWLFFAEAEHVSQLFYGAQRA